MHGRQRETLAHFGLDEERRALVPTITIFLIDGRMMLRGVLTAFLHHGNERADLSPGITGIVDVDRSLKRIVSHGLGVEAQKTYPVTLLQHQASKAVSTSSEIAGRAADESLIHDGNLQEILGQSSGLEIIVVGLADTSKKAHWSRPAKLKLEHGEHEAFGLQDLIDRVTTINHVDDLIDGRAVDLLIFRRNEDSSGTDQLELAQGDNLA